MSELITADVYSLRQQLDQATEVNRKQLIQHAQESQKLMLEIEMLRSEVDRLKNHLSPKAFVHGSAKLENHDGIWLD